MPLNHSGVLFSLCFTQTMKAFHHSYFQATLDTLSDVM